MNYLILIWQIACVLVLASLLWMITLILLRIIRTHRQSLYTKQRQQILEAMAQILWDEKGEAAIPDETLWKSPMVPEVFLEFVALVRGEERDRLIARMVRYRVDDEFRRLLRHRFRFVRHAAVEALAYFPGLPTAKAVDSLVERSANHDLRIAGIRTLVAVGAYPTVPDVMREFSKLNGSTRSLQSVLSKLALHRSRDILEYLGRPGVPDLERAALLSALGGSADYSVLGILEAALSSDVPLIRVAALDGLASLEHPDAAPAIASCLKDTDWSVRAGAVKTLCEISYDTYAAQVADLLSDPVWLVQFEAAQALADMGASGRELLEVSAISKGNESANRTAALALAELSAMEAVQ